MNNTSMPEFHAKPPKARPPEIQIKALLNIDIGNPGVAGENKIIRIGTQGVQTATYLAGTVYANGVALISDLNAKENFTAVNAKEVLAKVTALPVTEWNYKSDRKDVQHLGPMAQDFQAAFGLDGADDKHISVVDEGGVALAAIQGLNQKVEQKDAEIQDLKARLQKLEDLLNATNGGAK
jgi:outer membrane murein-binding lipoprotein Lpp